MGRVRGSEPGDRLKPVATPGQLETAGGPRSPRATCARTGPRAGLFRIRAQRGSKHRGEGRGTLFHRGLAAAAAAAAAAATAAAAAEPPANEDFAGAPWMANAEICFRTSVALHEGQVTTWSSLRTSSSKWSSHSMHAYS